MILSIKAYAGNTGEYSGQLVPIYVHGKVLNILEDTVDEDNYIRYQKILVEVRESDFSNQQITAENIINLVYINKIIVQPGDDIILIAENNNGVLEGSRVYSYSRDKSLLYLLIIFISLLIFLGGKNGLYSLISLSISVLIIIFGFFPLILKGVPPIVAVTGICTIATAITLLAIGGFKTKTYAAFIGTIGGVITAGLLTFYFGQLSHIHGLNDENVELLTYFPKGCNFNFRDLLYAGIIIGALGAIMDVSMSIASAMEEIYNANQRISKVKLFHAGMRVGKDIMGTMSNTLILAYTGNSINLILVFFVYDLSFTQFINSNNIATEILRALCGSIGLVFTIPITALSYLCLYKNSQKNYRRFQPRN